MTAPPATSSRLAPAPATSSGSTQAVNGLGFAFHDVSRRYGALWALRRVSLQIAAGEFVLLRGANGSGKSTLLRAAATLVRPTMGRIDYLGPAKDGLQARARIGFVAHSTMLYDHLSASENLRFYGNLYGLPDIEARAGAALGSVGLTDRRDSMVRTFSRGMRQRLSLARALLHSPGLLLLDEPLTGLDQQAHDWLGRTLTGLHEAGCTIVMSAHGDAGTSRTTRCIWLDAGQVVRDDTPEVDSGEGRGGQRS